MKKITVVLLSLIAVWGCKKSGPGTGREQNGNQNETGESRFLVDKVYDYHDRLIAEYFYNDDNRLIKRKYTDPETGGSSDYDVSYENGKPKEIKFTDYQFPEFNHNIILSYNGDGKIVRDETFQAGHLVSYRNYSYYDNGKIKGIFDDSGFEYCTIGYVNTDNAVEVTWKVPDNGDGTGSRYKNVVKTYAYDDHPRPDFGTGNIFQFDPLPRSNTVSLFEKNISRNNMVLDDDQTTWMYTYNEDKLPLTIETKWDSIDTETPLMIKIQYKTKK